MKNCACAIGLWGKNKHMHSILAFSSLVNCFAILGLGEFIFLKDRKSPLNRVFAALCAAAGAWAFIEFMYRQASTYAMADYWVHVYAIAWPFVTPISLHFALIFTKKTKWLQKKMTYVLIYLPPLAFSIIDLNTRIITPGPVKLPWGYATGTPANEFYFLLTTGWTAILGISGLVLVWRYRNQVKDFRIKKQASLITIGFALPIAAGIITQIIMPAAGIVFPELTTTFLVILVGFVSYAILKYGLFVVSPESAVQNIVTTMSDALIIIGPKGNILSANLALLQMLDYSEHELLGKYAVSLWESDREIRPSLNRALGEGVEIKNLESRLRKKNGDVIDVLFSSSNVRDQNGELAGIIGIATDITELKEAQQARGIAEYLQEVQLRLPETLPGIDFGHRYRSAAEKALVGGDFLDLFELGEDKIGILVGDVSGKGLEASALTSIIKDAVKAYSQLDPSPVFIMSKTNELCVKTSEPYIFVTVFFGILNIRSGDFIFCNAGHPPGLVKTGKQVKTLDSTSMVIGVADNARYFAGKAKMALGDVLIIYTDGITEARYQGELYGEQRLIELVRSRKMRNTKKIPDLILDEIATFTKGTLSDDVVILALSLR